MRGCCCTMARSGRRGCLPAIIAGRNVNPESLEGFVGEWNVVHGVGRQSSLAAVGRRQPRTARRRSGGSYCSSCSGIFDPEAFKGNEIDFVSILLVVRRRTRPFLGRRLWQGRRSLWQRRGASSSCSGAAHVTCFDTVVSHTTKRKKETEGVALVRVRSIVV